MGATPMKRKLRLLLPALAAFVTLTLAQTPAAAPTPVAAPMAVDASAPLPKTGNARFFQLHESFLARARSAAIGVLFLGDSITEGWRKAPHIWEHCFGKYEPANFGIGGDQTQHVIWRIENGEFEGINPKVVVLMIGTNNSGQHTGAEIAAANRKIVELVRSKLPEAKILLHAIFPRGPRKNREGVITYESILDAQKRMAAISIANVELAKLDDGQMVRFVDINARFLGNDGTIPNIIMPDQLHPNAAGYQLWAEAIEAPLAEMMK
jgi:lysophospholipase L1-like esterase